MMKIVPRSLPGLAVTPVRLSINVADVFSGVAADSDKPIYLGGKE
ncbi:MAG: hypothetical protein QF752_08460 [Planctomycetota bacterium]|jgi:hypothetical protein|nr:hypothetical protein [Planctomycetota bacterium]